MHRRMLVTVLLAGALAGCGDASHATKAVSLSKATPVPRVTVTVTVTATPSSCATPSSSSSSKPTVDLTLDTNKAMKELDRLRKSGWYNPNKVEYADDAVVSLLQFRYWAVDKGYIGKDGGWTAAARAKKAWTDHGYENGQMYKKYMAGH